MTIIKFWAVIYDFLKMEVFSELYSGCLNAFMNLWEILTIDCSTFWNICKTTSQRFL